MHHCPMDLTYTLQVERQNCYQCQVECSALTPSTGPLLSAVPLSQSVPKYVI
jgi:hypothetical protein